MSGELWRVSHTYRDKAGIKFEDDELLRWLNTKTGTISNSGGIRFKDAATNTPFDPETGRPIPAYLVLITRDMSAQHHNPWDDDVDQASGNIYYWGDAKFSSRGKLFNQFPGNARIEAINNLRLAGRMDELPPILHFSKKKSGYLTFNGLCTLADVRHAWFEDQGKPIKNLRLSNVSAYGTTQRDCIREGFWLIVVTEGNEDEAEIGDTPDRCGQGDQGHPPGNA